jgi:hypothetical protein
MRPVAGVSIRRGSALPSILQLKAADSSTALSEFSGVDAAGKQVRNLFLLKMLGLFEVNYVETGHFSQCQGKLVPGCLCVIQR